MKRILTYTILVLLGCINSSAEDIVVDGINYNVDIENRSAEVIRSTSGYKGDIVIPSNIDYNGVSFAVTKIRERAFESCVNLTSIIIPSSITSIGRQGFANCRALTTVTIPEGVSIINDETFYGCSSLTSLTIPESVTSIGYMAFFGCYGISSITISDNVVSIGRSAFSGCFNLSDITISPHLISVGTDAFGSTAWYNSQPDGVVYWGSVLYKYKGLMEADTEIEIAPGTQSIAESAFSMLDHLTSVSIPEGVITIGNSAFTRCTKLTSITIPNSVTSIGAGTFVECSSLEQVTLPNHITSISDMTFSSSALTTIVVPEGVTYIGQSAFANCPLITVDLPETLQEMGLMAFCGCNQIQMVYCRASTPPTIIDAHSYDFPHATLLVPASSIETYKTATGWNGFGIIAALDDQDIGYHPFIEKGKHWCVHNFNEDSEHTVTDYYFSDDEEVIAGHSYAKMFAKTGDQESLQGLFREEGRRAYMYDKNRGIEVKAYDFTLREGDEIDLDVFDVMHCKVQRIGEQIVNGEHLKVTDLTVATQKDEGGNYIYDKTIRWIESVGTTSAPLKGLHPDNSSSWHSSLAYAYSEKYFLPFSFGNPQYGLWGNGIEANEMDINNIDESRHYQNDISYSLVPDPEHNMYALRIKGMIWLPQSEAKYIYCILDESYDASMTRKIHFQYEYPKGSLETVKPYYITGLLLPYFNPDIQYIAVDENGECVVFCQKDTPVDEDYHPFIEEGKEWKVGLADDGRIASQIIYYYFQGDTIIDGRECKKMIIIQKERDKEQQTYYAGAIFENERHVYLIEPNSTVPKLIYDFVSPKGTIIDTYNPNDALVLSYIETTITNHYLLIENNFKGHSVEVSCKLPVEMDQYGKITYEINPPEQWLEGVGSCYSPLMNCSTHPGLHYSLMRCAIGDEVLYYNPTIIDGVTLSNPAFVKKQWLDFTHTVKTRPKAPRSLTPSPSPAGEESEGSELTGEYSLKELFVNFKPLSGSYVITICDDSGTEVYRKEVQTSNVIGLNTDISGYEKGEYTITVENEEEAYTASFSIDDAVGINRPTPDPSRDGGEKAGAWYDLSGRKLYTPSPEEGRSGLSRTLPKGIYIKDGRKIVVR